MANWFWFLKCRASVCLGIMKEEVGYWILYLLLVSQDISSSLGCQFCGTDGELQVVMNLLKHAEILLQMDIICHHEKFSDGLARERDVLEKLQMLPRASTYCTINISWIIVWGSFWEMSFTVEEIYPTVYVFWGFRL